MKLKVNFTAKMNLKQFNNERLGKLYTKTLKRYRGLKNIGKYKKQYLNYNDVITDAYLKFVHFNDLSVLEVSDDELSEMFDKMVKKTIQRSWNPELKENKHVYTNIDSIFEGQDISYLDTVRWEEQDVVGREFEEIISKYKVLSMVYEGYRVKEIMEEFGVSRPTVEKWRASQFEQLNRQLCLV